MFLNRSFPIAKALDHGADVVVTGRCVDSALTLGPLIHKVGNMSEIEGYLFATVVWMDREGFGPACCGKVLLLYSKLLPTSVWLL